MTPHDFCGYRSCALTLFLAALIVADSSLAMAAPITYQIVPYTVSDGSRIDDGFIKTDGTLGAINFSHIIDYRIEVTGPAAYVFTPSFPGTIQNHTEGTILATSTSIVVPVDSDPVPDLRNQLIFNFFDNSSPSCTNCEQLVDWRNQYAPSEPYNQNESVIDANYIDLDDFDPVLGGYIFTSPQAEILVATVVPEPAGAVLSLFGACLAYLALRREKRSDLFLRE